MARVLMAQDVADGLIPNKDSFQAVFEQIKNRLSRLDGIESAISIGSVHRGDSNCLSDMDIVIAFDRAVRATVFDSLSELCLFGHTRFVKVEFIPLISEFAFAGAHTISTPFISHIAWAEENGGLIRGEPLTKRMKPKDRNRPEGLDYAVIKLDKIIKRILLMPLMDEKELNALLREVLQVPIYLARVILWDKGLQLPVDSKVAVIDAFRKMGSRDSVNAFDLLLGFATDYRRMVESRPPLYAYKRQRKNILQYNGLHTLICFLEVIIAEYLDLN